MNFRKQLPLESLSESLRSWFAGELGQDLLASEQRIINILLPRIYGATAVQIGIDPLCDMAEESSIPYRVMVHHSLTLGMTARSVIAQATELPFEHNSVDLVILHHSLDFTQNPHQVLREAERILRPGGHIILVAFNPISWWGIRRLFTRKSKQGLWQQAHFISHHRLVDWISLLELTELRTLSDYFLPPCESTGLRKRFSFLQPFGRRSFPRMGAFNVILARKDIGGAILTTNKRVNRTFITLPVAKPATRGQMRETR